MGRSQRAKGQRIEREAAAYLASWLGGEWRRGHQTRGGGREEPDVHSDDWPWLHVEVKGGKAPRLWPATEQAARDCEAGGREAWLVLARRDREDWRVLCEPETMDRLMRQLRAGE